jgi:hypothetical protein
VSLRGPQAHLTPQPDTAVATPRIEAGTPNTRSRAGPSFRLGGGWCAVKTDTSTAPIPAAATIEPMTIIASPIARMTNSTVCVPKAFQSPQRVGRSPASGCRRRTITRCNIRLDGLTGLQAATQTQDLGGELCSEVGI